MDLAHITFGQGNFVTMPWLTWRLQECAWSKRDIKGQDRSRAPSESSKHSVNPDTWYHFKKRTAGAFLVIHWGLVARISHESLLVSWKFQWHPSQMSERIRSARWISV